MPVAILDSYGHHCDNQTETLPRREHPVKNSFGYGILFRESYSYTAKLEAIVA